MLKEERFQYILDELSKNNKVLLDKLSDDLHVSVDTIRRDIKELDTQGLLKAVRGGAVPHSPNPLNFMDRLDYDSEAKQIIANKALSLFHDGQTVIFDGGTSTLAIANLLPKELKLTVVTNSFPIANLLKENEHVDILFAGGRLFKSSFVTVGYDSTAFFMNIRADLCFLGICSLHTTLGVTSPDYEESKVKAVMTEASQHTIALATPKKLDTVEPYLVCTAADIGTIITSDDSDKKLKPFREMGIEVL